MQRLVYLDGLEQLDTYLEQAAWHHVDGFEVDLTKMTETEYLALTKRLEAAPVKPLSLHYERTNTIALNEWDLFESQLRMIADRARGMGCHSVSVHPPRIEQSTPNTIKDLQAFVARVDAFAAEADIEICFELTGFMKDPQMMNAAFDDLEDPSLGVMVDLDVLVDGIDPVFLLGKISAGIRKVRIPMSLKEMDEGMVPLTGDVAAVATSIE